MYYQIYHLNSCMSLIQFSNSDSLIIDFEYNFLIDYFISILMILSDHQSYCSA